MRTIRFARLSFERKLSHYTDERSAIERRKAALLEVIDYETDVNSLLIGTNMEKKINLGQWSFGDISEGKDYISGRIGKVKEEHGRKPDDEVKGFPKVEREDTDIAFFVIDLTNSVMAYEVRHGVGQIAPFTILEAAFNSYYDGEEDISISPLVDKDQVREEIRQLKRISQVQFKSLKPTNPNSTDRSKPMDDFLQSGQIDRLMFDALNSPDNDGGNDEGIRVEEEPLLDGGLSLAEEGYGKAIVRGKGQDGEDKMVSTDDRPIESKVDMAEPNDWTIQKLREEIRRALKRLED
ncbi:hypothetical protein [Halomontanus rarus]|uniref:hypothetical protein n=1 Tax=Halomontanus rarus TaxID=3034020 RepID=UPI0023E81F4E|nr:hypothetical protein [Halovivax sp. TS33]